MYVYLGSLHYISPVSYMASLKEENGLTSHLKFLWQEFFGTLKQKWVTLPKKQGFKVDKMLDVILAYWYKAVIYKR